MIPGVSFDDKHCTDDLGMILAEKEIGAPEVQSNFVDVPGRNGPLDFTEGLTGDVRYGARMITLTFVTCENISKQNWADFLMTIEDELHGFRKKIIFDEDAGYYYSGRCAINEFATSWGKQTITIECTCDPFKEQLPYAYYFAIYCATDGSLTFYGDDELPSGTYGGKAVTTVYKDVMNTGESNPPWYSSRSSFKSVLIDKSFAGCKPTSCYQWFYGCSNCTAIDGLKYLDTSSVTTMYYIFTNCSSLTTLDVSNFNTSAMTNMNHMFYGCSNLTTLDVSNFNTSAVTNMSYMFYGCSALTTIYSNDNNFVTTKVTSGGYMFTSCTKLVGGNGTAFDSNKTSYTMAHVDTASNPGYFTKAV